MDTHIPVYIEFRGLKVAVVGGGSVGTRRAKLLSEAGADVTIYSIDFTEEIRELAEEGKVKLVKLPKDIAPEVLADFIPGNTVLVVIATSNLEFNKRLSRILLSRGILVNNATDARVGNTVFPFRGEVYDGGIRISVTSLGRTGVAARRVLEYCIESLEDNSYLRNLYAVMSKFKSILVSCISDPKRRFPLYFEVDRDGLFHELVRAGSLEDALARALEIAGVPEDCTGNPPR